MKATQLRKIEIIRDYTKYAAGSVLIKWGNTWVLCTASVEDKVPPFLKDSGRGWVTAEYAMLPSCTPQRKDRDIKKLKLDARATEIQRLIGRALRASVDTTKLGERQITVDCDVLQADGGTRCASITGGMVALEIAVGKLLKAGVLKENPIVHRVAAVSVGVCGGKPTLDLDYAHDSAAEVDLNVVMTDDGRFVELQGCAEHNPFTAEHLADMLALARKGLAKIFKLKPVALMLALAASLAAAAGVTFREDFSNYRDPAPGVSRSAELIVLNDPIYQPRSSIAGAVTKDTDVFLAPKALPAGNAFDVLCSFGLARDATLELVFTAADGKTLVVPYAGFDGWRHAAVTAKDGKLVQWVTETNRYVEVKSYPIAGTLKTVNFRFRKGGHVELTDIVIRTGAPLPDTSGLRLYPALAAVTRGLGPSARTSDGAPLDLLGKSYSFVPGATGVVGRLELTWDTGAVQKHPISVGDALFCSRLPRGGYARVGIKPKGRWYGPDGVVNFGYAAKLHVRPLLNNYAGYTDISDQGTDLFRDWAKLPPASKHVTTVEMRGGTQLWVDGSYAANLTPPRDAKGAKTVVKAALVLEKGVSYRVNKAADPDELQLWARPKAKAFADAAPDSADVGLAHYGMHRVSYECDTYMGRNPLDGFLGEVHFRVPAAPYAQAVIRFVLDDVPDKVPLLKARMARYWRSDGVGSPEVAESVLDLTKGMPPSVAKDGSLVRGGKTYPIYKATVDLPLGPCLDYASGDFIDIEFVGPTEENMLQDDRRLKPREDVSSAFNLLSVRLSRLNVVPELVQTEPGNIFTEDAEVKTTAVRLTACVDGAKGILKFGEREIPYALAKAGDVVTNVFDFSDATAGWYELPVVIDDGRARIRHDLVYCVTPEAGRLATAEEAPYATWWFEGMGSEGRVAVGGPILQKAGIRKNSIRPMTADEYRRYDCTSEGFIYAPKEHQFDAKTGKFRGGRIKRDGKMVEVDGETFVVEQMKAAIAKKPFVDHIMVWHESAPWEGNLPEEILGLPVPTNHVALEKRIAAYIDEVGRICHKHFPQLKVQVGNSNASIGAAVVPFRGGAKPDSIDQFGMEIPSQTIPPERLFDFTLLGMNVTKAVAKKLTGRDYPAAGCYEFTYRPERDNGVGGEEVQARYHTRDILISLMNGFRLIAPGTFFDCRHSYCNSVYGQAGILHRTPYVYPKKAYQAYAVATKVMDGVTFVRTVPTGSTSVYAAEFRRKDGRLATAFWCARGEADLVCDVKGELWTMYGARADVGGWFSDAEFTCSPAPCYVISKNPCKSVKIAARRFADDAKLAAKGRAVADISLANVTVAPDPEIESTHYAFLPYLKPGVFTAKDVVDPEEGACLELTLDTAAKPCAPITEFVTEYTTVRFKQPVALAGRTALLGLRVKANSNWGQVRFEIEDAEGEVFKGLSTGKSWGCDIYDWPCYTALSFDGWGDVYQYTDANDYGLVISPGPRDEQWCSMTGGNKKIDFPVKLRAVTIPVNRYKPTLLGFEKTENPTIRLKRVWAAR